MTNSLIAVGAAISMFHPTPQQLPAFPQVATLKYEVATPLSLVSKEEVSIAIKPWSRTHLDIERSLEINWWLLALVDTAQTADFSSKGHKELNPLVKRWVDNKQIFEFVMVVGLSCYLLDKAVHLVKNPTIRTVLFGIFYCVEFWATYHNRNLFGKGIPVMFVPIFKF